MNSRPSRSIKLDLSAPGSNLVSFDIISVFYGILLETL